MYIEELRVVHLATLLSARARRRRARGEDRSEQGAAARAKGGRRLLLRAGLVGLTLRAEKGRKEGTWRNETRREENLEKRRKRQSCLRPSTTATPRRRRRGGGGLRAPLNSTLVGALHWAAAGQA